MKQVLAITKAASICAHVVTSINVRVAEVTHEAVVHDDVLSVENALVLPDAGLPSACTSVPAGDVDDVGRYAPQRAAVLGYGGQVTQHYVSPRLSNDGSRDQRMAFFQRGAAKHLARGVCAVSEPHPVSIAHGGSYRGV